MTRHGRWTVHRLANGDVPVLRALKHCRNCPVGISTSDFGGKKVQDATFLPIVTVAVESSLSAPTPSEGAMLAGKHSEAEQRCVRS